MSVALPVFYWYGGIIATPLSEAVIRASGQGNDRSASGARQRRALRDLSQEACLGRLSAEEFCARAAQALDGLVGGEALLRQVAGSVRLDSKALAIISETCAACDNWLIVDYPPAWWQDLSQDPALSAIFPAERMLPVAEWRLPRLVPDLFYQLARSADRRLEDCLYFDYDSWRGSAAVRAGMGAAVYVDHVRLRREFVLRRIL